MPKRRLSPAAESTESEVDPELWKKGLAAETIAALEEAVDKEIDDEIRAWATPLLDRMKARGELPVNFTVDQMLSEMDTESASKSKHRGRRKALESGIGSDGELVVVHILPPVTVAEAGKGRGGRKTKSGKARKSAAKRVRKPRRSGAGEADLRTAMTFHIWIVAYELPGDDGQTGWAPEDVNDNPPSCHAFMPFGPSLPIESAQHLARDFNACEIARSRGLWAIVCREDDQPEAVGQLLRVQSAGVDGPQDPDASPKRVRKPRRPAKKEKHVDARQNE